MLWAEWFIWAYNTAHKLSHCETLTHSCTGDDTDGEEDEDDGYEEAPLHNSSSACDALLDMDQHDGNDSDDSEGAAGCLTRLNAPGPLLILQCLIGLVKDSTLWEEHILNLMQVCSGHIPDICSGRVAPLSSVELCLPVSVL